MKGGRICSRKGCNKMLCSTRINKIGYLCKDCLKEFKDNFPDKLLGLLQ